MKTALDSLMEERLAEVSAKVIAKTTAKVSAETTARVSADLIVIILKQRFGSISKSLESKIRKIFDYDIYKELLIKANQTESLKDFEQYL
jgi:hypothetical protein